MACIVVKKVLGYELCILEKEGTLFYSDPIVIIRKDKFMEIYNLQKHAHETGDVIEREKVRSIIYEFIEDHSRLFMQ